MGKRRVCVEEGGNNSPEVISGMTFGEKKMGLCCGRCGAPPVAGCPSVVVGVSDVWRGEAKWDLPVKMQVLKS